MGSWGCVNVPRGHVPGPVQETGSLLVHVDVPQVHDLEKKTERREWLATGDIRQTSACLSESTVNSNKLTLLKELRKPIAPISK